MAINMVVESWLTISRRNVLMGRRIVFSWRRVTVDCVREFCGNFLYLTGPFVALPVFSIDEKPCQSVGLLPHPGIKST